MSARETLGELFEIGKDILATVLNKTTNIVQAQIGDSTSSQPDSDAAEWWQHTGFVSRPAVPTQGAASCQGLILKCSDRDIIFATRDTRNSAIWGALKDGEACAFAPTGMARTFWKNNGATVTYTTSDNTATGVSMSLEFGSDGMHVTTPWGIMSLDASGFTVSVGTAAILLKPSGEAQVFATSIDIHGQLASIAGDVATCIGNKVTPLVPAFAALKGTPANPTPSTNVWISA